MTEQLNDQLNEKELTKERFVYLYNPLQASFYMSQGVVTKDTGIHPVTKHIWYKFVFSECTNAYEIWCSRKK